MPNFNSSACLDETLNSVFNQTYKNWKLIIIDDNSDEKTKKILRRINNEKIKIVWLSKNKGQGFCRNLALRNHCKSDYIAFLDADDLWDKNKLEKQIDFMIKNKYEFTYTYYEVLKTEKNNLKKIKTPLKFNFQSFTKNTSIATSSMIIKKNLAKTSKFTNAKSCDDYYYKCCLLNKTKFAYCLDDYLLIYRVRAKSVQSSKFRNIYWIWKINREMNNFSFFKNLISLIFISFNSLKKYGFR